MENNDTKTDYQEIVRAGDQMWEMVEITIGIIFFVCLFEIHVPIFFIYYLNYICWNISSLHFKTFKIQLHGVPPFALWLGL